MYAIQYIKENLTKEIILDLLKRHGAKGIVDNETSFRSSCPLHKGNNTTSFSWNLTNNLWCCFSECGGGDIFDFIALLYDIDINKNFIGVVTVTATELGLNIEGMEIGNVEMSYRAEVDSWLQYMLKKSNIYNNPYDLSKLGDRYVLNEYRGLNKELLSEYGICYSKDFNRILFPIENHLGEVVGASLRRVDETEKIKWLHRPKSIKTSMLLYNVKNVIDEGHKTVYIVEGMIDVLNLRKLGLRNVVCSFGDKITKSQMLILIQYFDEVVLMFDNDKAGIKAIHKAIGSLKGLINLSVALIGDKKDPGEIESLEEITIIPFWEFK